jgi:hypothetical protein
LGRADIAAIAARRYHELADAGGVAQSEIEALGADRRNEVGGFADQRDAALPEWRTVSTASGKDAAARLDRDLAEKRMRERRSISSFSAVSSSAATRSASAGLHHPNEARPLTGQRHQGERTLSV